MIICTPYLTASYSVPQSARHKISLRAFDIHLASSKRLLAIIDIAIESNFIFAS
jgi:hypothetical protein